MRHLLPPVPDTSAETIFKECVEAFSDPSRKRRLEACLPLVKADSENFEKMMPYGMADFCISPLPSDVSIEELLKVYQDKFAHKDTPGRKYYNQIMLSPSHGICPICGVRPVSNLDHYLPKSQFPTLQVTPLNLVPTCRDCNFDKHAHSTLEAKSIPLNPYFDDISRDCWLGAKPLSDQSVLYYADCPRSWPQELQSRVRQHLELYELPRLYGIHAMQEVGDSICLWKELYHSVNIKIVLQHFIDVCKSAEENNLNSWKAALYRGLIREIDVVKTWLEL